MSYLEDFKTKIGQIVFQNQLKKNKRIKEVCNLENAKSIGILYDATNESQINQIQPFDLTSLRPLTKRCFIAIIVNIYNTRVITQVST